MDKFNVLAILRRPHKYIEKKFLEYGVRHAGIIVAQTVEQSDLLEEHYARAANHVIRNFLEIPRVRSKPPRPITVLWIGNFKPVKQPQYFLELAHSLNCARHVRFEMIGAPSPDVWWQAELNEKIQAIPALRHLGALSQEHVNDRLASAHILVNTSVYEGFSNTFIQAWMHKVPVVSLCVNPDGVFDKYGIGKLAGNIDNLCDEVQRLIEDDSSREQMGSQARKYAIKFHSLENAKNLVALIKTMLVEASDE